jgi:hypothetical protein
MRAIRGGITYVPECDTLPAIWVTHFLLLFPNASRSHDTNAGSGRRERRVVNFR